MPDQVRHDVSALCRLQRLLSPLLGGGDLEVDRNRLLPGEPARALHALRESGAVGIIPAGLALALALLGGEAHRGEEVDEGDPGDGGDGDQIVALLLLVGALEARGEGAEIDKVAGEARPDRGSGRVAERPDAGADLAPAIGTQQRLLALQAQPAAELARRDQLGGAEGEAEPAEVAGDAVRLGEAAVGAARHERRGGVHHAISIWGLRTTFTQLSCFCSNTRYMPGPSSREAVWVMTKLGSIWPSSMRRTRSPVQRRTWVWPMRKVRPLFIAMPNGILSTSPP